jgi:hypothetical protein
MISKLKFKGNADSAKRKKEITPTLPRTLAQAPLLVCLLPCLLPCPGVLAHLHDVRFCPLESHLLLAPALIVVADILLITSSATRDDEGIAAVSYFAPASRLLAPWCPPMKEARGGQVHGVLRSDTFQPRFAHRGSYRVP